MVHHPAQHLAAATLAAFVAATPAHAYTFTTLYNFTRGTDGAQPLGGVVQDAAGTLDGETYTGGATQCTPMPGPSLHPMFSPSPHTQQA